MRTRLGVILVSVIVSTASAGNLIPDPFNIYPYPGWDNPPTVHDHEDGTFTASIDNGSGGVYWRLPAEASEVVSVEGQWTGDVGGAGWAEIITFTCTEGMSDTDIINRLDAGNAGDIVIKKDSWGLNTPPNAWGWEDIALSAVAPLEIHSTCEEVVIAVKVGDGGGGGTSVTFDISYVPEPGTILLLGLPMMLIPRWR